MTQSEQIWGNDTSILAQYKLQPTFNLFKKKKVIKQSVIKCIYFIIHNTRFVLLDLISKYTIHQTTSFHLLLLQN